MLSRIFTAFLTVSLAQLPVHAQDIRATTSGFLFSAGTLRPILGVPGAAYIGSSLAEGLSAAWAAPNRRWAFAVREGRTVLVRGLDGRQLDELADSSLIQDVQRVVWNPAGSAAVLFSSTLHHLQRVRVSSGLLTTEPPIDLLYLDGTPAAFAIDSAARISVTIPSRGVFVSDWGADLQLCAQLERVTALAFSTDGSLYAADAASESLYRIRKGGEGWSVEKVASSLPDVVGIVPVSGNRNGNHKLHVISSDGPRVRTLNFGGELESDLTLEQVPTCFETLQWGIFLLKASEGSKSPALVLDVRDQPVVYFVPAGDVSTL
jgi:hypothetical protein